jgi:hypothetical protein
MFSCNTLKRKNNRVCFSFYAVSCRITNKYIILQSQIIRAHSAEKLKSVISRFSSILEIAFLQFRNSAGPVMQSVTRILDLPAGRSGLEHLTLNRVEPLVL